MMKKKLKEIGKIKNATLYSFNGIKLASSERAIRQLLILHIILIAIMIFMPFDIAVKMVLLMASFISMIVELFNTAIEAAVDYTSTEYHILAKRAKDVASAAQMTALILLAILWILALVHYWHFI